MSRELREKGTKGTGKRRAKKRQYPRKKEGKREQERESTTWKENDLKQSFDRGCGDVWPGLKSSQGLGK